MRSYRIVQGYSQSLVFLTIACIGIACIIGRVLCFPRPSSAHLHHPSGAAPPAPPASPQAWARSRAPPFAPRPPRFDRVEAACRYRTLPASVPTRSRTAGCSRNSTRLPQKAVTAVPAPSLPSHRWRQLCRTPPSNVHVPAAGPFSACCLQRLSRDCAGLRSPRFVLRLSKGPLGIGQGTPNRLWLPTFKVPLTSMWTG